MTVVRILSLTRTAERERAAWAEYLRTTKDACSLDYEAAELVAWRRLCLRLHRLGRLPPLSR